MGCFGGYGLLKVSQQPGQPEEIPCENSGRDTPGDSTCCDSRVTGASQGLCWVQRAAILRDIIIIKNLKLLLINYLAQRVEVLFHFPSRLKNPCNRIYGKTL